jgi:hypothetical protein
VGYQDVPGDRSFALRQALTGTGAIRVDRRAVPYAEVLYRCAALLVSDSLDAAADFAVTGKPAVTWLGDDVSSAPNLRQEGAPRINVRDSVGLCEVLEELLAAVRPDRERVGRHEGRSAARLVRRVRASALGDLPAGLEGAAV